MSSGFGNTPHGLIYLLLGNLSSTHFVQLKDLRVHFLMCYFFNQLHRLQLRSLRVQMQACHSRCTAINRKPSDAFFSFSHQVDYNRIRKPVNLPTLIFKKPKALNVTLYRWNKFGTVGRFIREGYL